VEEERRRTTDMSVVGNDDGGGFGVHGSSDDRIGVIGESAESIGVFGNNITIAGGDRDDRFIGVRGKSQRGPGVRGQSENSYAVFGTSDNSSGVVGVTDIITPEDARDFVPRAGVAGRSNTYPGVVGVSNMGSGVAGSSNSSDGVSGYSDNGHGVTGYSASGTGVFGGSGSGYAAYLDGRVYIRGPLDKPGGEFRIDHPLDPANKYLSHSFVESPDMKNVYDGVVTLDDKGEADIELPDWFGALNKDFRYQLTAIGAPGPNLYISEEIPDGVTTTSYSSNSSNSGDNKNNNKNNNSRFKVAGGTSGMKVSWQVTGIRKDPWANAHRIKVEEDKPAKERGYYTYPELYGQPKEKGISRLLFPRDEEEKDNVLVSQNITM
jgi:hypothetical protein